MLFEMLTGDLPYSGGTHNERLVQKLRHNYSNMPLLTDRPDIPDVLKRFLARALSVAKADRFGSGKEMHAALQRIKEVLPPDVEEVGAPTDPHGQTPVISYGVAAGALSEPPRATRVVGRRMLNLVLVVAILVVCVVAAVGYALTWDQTQPTAVALPPEPAVVTSPLDAGDEEVDAQVDAAGVMANSGADAGRPDGLDKPNLQSAPRRPAVGVGAGPVGDSSAPRKPARVYSLPAIQRDRSKAGKRPER
jgi:hypothetical protein